MKLKEIVHTKCTNYNVLHIVGEIHTYAYAHTHTHTFILFHTAVCAIRMIFINSQLFFLDIFSGCI